MKAEVDHRSLDEMRKLAPPHPYPYHGFRPRLASLAGSLGFDGLHHRLTRSWHACVYCGHKAAAKQIVVNPITLQRVYLDLCRRATCGSKLQKWVGTARTRRLRAQLDWERENPTVAPLLLMEDIPPQYPSISRATLRAFLDSGLDAATVGGGGSWTVTSLNGSIKALGFEEQVYCETRSGQPVLRRCS